MKNPWKSAIRPTKISSPQTRWVRIRSSRSEKFSPSGVDSVVTCCAMANTGVSRLDGVAAPVHSRGFEAGSARR